MALVQIAYFSWILLSAIWVPTISLANSCIWSILSLSQSALEAEKQVPNCWKLSCSPTHNIAQSRHRHTKANIVKQLLSLFSLKHLYNQGQPNSAPREQPFVTLLLQPPTPGACWLRQIGKLSAAQRLLECFLIISGKYGLCIIINWTKHWRSVSQVPVNGAINSQRREVYSIWKLSFSIHLHSSPKVLSSGLLLSITLIRLIPS